MNRKTGIVFAIFLIVPVFGAVRLGASQTVLQELYYDDGAPEGSFWFTGPGVKTVAIRFTPKTTGKLMGCKFNVWNVSTTVGIHVMDTNKIDVITPFFMTPTPAMWNSANLSGYGVIVSAGVDFYLSIEWADEYTRINYDTSGLDNRSWYQLNGIWYQWAEGDYLIRALIETGINYTGTTYIRPDGNVWGGANISRNGDYYGLLADYYGSIVVQRDNITLDGAGYRLTGSGTLNSIGIYLCLRYNVTVMNFEITAFDDGIYLLNSSYNNIYRNNAVGNNIGIPLDTYSDYNRIIENRLAKNTRSGILLDTTSKNEVIGNNATENGRDGIELMYSNYSSITGNDAAINGRYGIELVSSNCSSIIENSLTANAWSGLGAFLSFNNTFSRNRITRNYDGVRIYNSSYNEAIANNITENNRYGLYFRDASDNTVCYNNFVNNNQRQALCNRSTNTWDNGYPSGGNYWSDYLPAVLCYDDGNPETFWSTDGGMAAVRFTSPMTGNLTSCRFCVWNIVFEPGGSWDDEFAMYIGVLNTDREDIIAPFYVSLTYNGWYDVNLSTYGVTVSAGTDFYIGIALGFYGDSIPRLDVDASNPDGRSWYRRNGTWTQWEGDYFIRATIETGVETGVDLCSGQNQDMSGSDGIGDTPYVIYDNNLDRYPRMLPFVQRRTDLNRDRVINIIDIAIAASAFGSRLGDPRWNQIADLDANAVINILDIAMVAMEYGIVY